jgi:hypothetical protein
MDASGKAAHVPIAGPFSSFEAVTAKLQTLLPTPEYTDAR